MEPFAMTAPALSAPQRLSRLAAIALLAAAALSGCTAMNAQNPSGRLKPVNAVADGGDERVMLKGADVVAYFTQGRYVQGTPQFRSVHEGVVFRFASAEHKAAFDAAPQKYLPQYGGFCTNGIVYAIPWGGDADTWRMIDGKLYIFGGRGSQEAFELDVPGNMKRGGLRQQQLLAAQQAARLQGAALQERRRAREGRGRREGEEVTRAPAQRG
jgi:YHS domain-containing protein